ncbi:hypothetical protein GCM10020000_30400 [Streptomyces olivoverticillatus]
MEAMLWSDPSDEPPEELREAQAMLRRARHRAGGRGGAALRGAGRGLSGARALPPPTTVASQLYPPLQPHMPDSRHAQ